MNSMKDKNDTAMFLAFACFLVVFLGVPIFYAAKAEAINGFLLSICKTELAFFSSISEEAAKGLAGISRFNPAGLSWEKMTAVLSFTGKYIRYPFTIFLLIFAGISFFLGRTENLNRRFSMDTLIKNNFEVFPCLTPIVGRGDYLLSRESYDSGHWAIARSPLQFAAKQGILLKDWDMPFLEREILKDDLGIKEMPAWGKSYFDAEKASAVFKDQIGKLYQGVLEMTPVRQALALAFALYATGKKQEGIDLLDQLSVSYREEKDKKPQLHILKDNNFLEEIKKGENLISQMSSSLHHAFELTFFMGLLTLARKKGVLAPSQFLFLRPIDRPLWYALNQCGGRAAWTESAAAWEHFHIEKAAKKAIAEPQIAGAVAGLKKELDRQGWLDDEQHWKEESWNRHIEQCQNAFV